MSVMPRLPRKTPDQLLHTLSLSSLTVTLRSLGCVTTNDALTSLTQGKLSLLDLIIGFPVFSPCRPQSIKSLNDYSAVLHEVVITPPLGCNCFYYTKRYHHVLPWATSGSLHAAEWHMPQISHSLGSWE